MKKIVFLFICILGGVIVGSGLLWPKDSTSRIPSPAKDIQQVASITSTSGITPKQITIPSIGVTADVESVGMDSQGRMDVPRKDENAAWYNLGFKPGDKGSAVIDGHFDKASGQPAVFYKLSSLNSGDTISVIGENDQRLTFIVTEVTYYNFDEFPLQKVFNTTDVPRLNLITCDGAWDTTTKNYSKRLVVYSKLAPTP